MQKRKICTLSAKDFDLEAVEVSEGKTLRHYCRLLKNKTGISYRELSERMVEQGFKTTGDNMAHFILGSGPFKTTGHILDAHNLAIACLRSFGVKKIIINV